MDKLFARCVNGILYLIGSDMRIMSPSAAAAAPGPGAPAPVQTPVAGPPAILAGGAAEQQACDEDWADANAEEYGSTCQAWHHYQLGQMQQTEPHNQ